MGGFLSYYEYLIEGRGHILPLVSLLRRKNLIIARKEEDSFKGRVSGVLALKGKRKTELRRYILTKRLTISSYNWRQVQVQY